MDEDEFVWDGRGNRSRKARLSIMPGGVARDMRLRELHLRILAHLGCFNANDGWCRLSQKEMAEWFGVHRQRVSEVIRQLIEWKFVELRGQDKTGESYCYYRTILDPRAATEQSSEPAVKQEITEADQGVSAGAGHSPPVSAGSGHSCPAGADTSVLVRGHTNQSIDIIGIKGDTREQVSPDGVTDDAAGQRLPFTPQTLRTVERAGVNPGELVQRYQARTKRKRIRNPNAYLLQMALDEVAKALGTPAETLRPLMQSNNPHDVGALVAAMAMAQASPLDGTRFTAGKASEALLNSPLMQAGRRA